MSFLLHWQCGIILLAAVHALISLQFCKVSFVGHGRLCSHLAEAIWCVLALLDVWVRLGCSGGAGLAHCLMEADVTVFKARIRTGKAKQVTDEFWVYDNRCELPNDIRWDQGPVSLRGRSPLLLYPA